MYIAHVGEVDRHTDTMRGGGWVTFCCRLELEEVRCYLVLHNTPLLLCGLEGANCMGFEELLKISLFIEFICSIFISFLNLSTYMKIVLIFFIEIFKVILREQKK